MGIPDFNSEFSHYGTKGMHWGVRKARTGDVAVARAKIKKTTTRLDRVAKGTGSKTDKAVALANTRIYRAPALARKGGLKNEAARESARYKDVSAELKAHSDRLAKGNATAKDILRAYGQSSIVSVARSLKD
jgi:hypothetical protein